MNSSSVVSAAGLMVGVSMLCMTPVESAASTELLLTPVMWYAAKYNPNLHGLIGDTECDWGDSDCNVCAFDVQGQFEDAFEAKSILGWYSGLMGWAEKPWHFDWETNYPPYGRTPDSAFGGVFDEHIQGFTRTNSSKYPYAGTHSNNNGGSVFFIQQNSDGRKILTSLHNTLHWHPSGVHVLGRYLYTADRASGKTYIRSYDVESNGTKQDVKFVPAGTNRLEGAGGGLGLAKLKDGAGWVLLGSTPGSHDAGERHNYFYHLEGNPRTPTKTTYLGDWLYEQPSGWNHDYRYSENLTLITECDTGDLYAVHSTSVEDEPTNGYFRLSKVTWDGNDIGMNVLNSYWVDTEMHSCHTRSSGTAHVNALGIIDLYCHEYKNTEPFLVNSDSWDFKQGSGYYLPPWPGN